VQGNTRHGPRLYLFISAQQGKNMTRSFKPLTFALMCVCAACGSTTSTVWAAQPAAAPAATRAVATPGIPQPLPVAPGTFTSFKATAAEVVAGKPLSFKFEGSGHCKLKLNSGDGYVNDFEGDLPFSGVYVYGTGSMSSYDAFKNYTASATPTGNCKSSGSATTVSVKVINPAPQGVSAPGNTPANTMSSSKPGLLVKP
jgi:hypothetical protein